MKFALTMNKVQKRYGKVFALDGLSLSVPTGAICAFVGPNGAGKTTTMAVLSGFIQPDVGEVDLLGLGPFDPERHQGRVGVLPQDAELPLASSPRQLLRAWGALQGLSRADAAAATDRVLRDVLLFDRADIPIRALSHGMRRRVTVASALLGDPELILLDEPTSGLDPVQAQHLRDVLGALRGRKTVLISSHNLLELETLCDHVVFVDHGRCVRAGPMTAITGADREVRIQLCPPFPEGRPEWVQLRLERDDPRSLEGATTALLQELIAEGALIREVRRGESLERKYLSETASP